MVYVPIDFAHGFQTLTDDTEVIYQMSEYYSPNHADGFRWNDPSFKIKWLSDNFVISSKDQNYPDFKTGSRRS
jgi:dTDP-4-dehydrorhamnose 3,5-epimerase